ncbi:MAG: hypothetical protein LBE32_05335 [Burkholderiales bacterium]|nr:hypothetical protein [Burkholderiales bacterium]
MSRPAMTPSSEFSSVVLSVILLCENESNAISLQALSEKLEATFPYYELVVVFNPMPAIEALEKELLQYPNTRSIVLNNHAPESVLRERALETCIGDQLLFWDSGADTDFIPRLVESNMGGNEFTGLEYTLTDTSLYGKLVRIFYFLLGILAGYSLNPRLSPIGCYSRSLVNAVNAGNFDISYLRLFLASVGFRFTFLQGGAPPRRPFWQAILRLTESFEIIGSVPVRLLQLTAAITLVACAACCIYILYVLVVMIFFTDVQKGWGSLSLALTACFSIFFFAFFVFSCIFLNRFSRERREKFVIARESHRTDFIQQFSQINVTDEF